MNWPAFALMAWAALGLELGLKPAMRLGVPGVAPSFVCVLVTLMFLFAPKRSALWCALFLGLAMDLTFQLPVAGAGAGLHVVGPYVLGFVAASQVVFAMRSMVFRRNPVTLGVLSLFASLTSNAVVWIIITVRARWLDQLAWDAWHELWTRCTAGVLTGLLGLVFAPLLIPLMKHVGMDAPGFGASVMGGRAAKY